MSKKFKIDLPSIIVVVIVNLLVAGVLLVSANWTAPLSVPPTCNAGDPGCDAPLNVGPSTQLKLGALGVNGVFRAFSDAFFSGRVGIGNTTPAARLVVNNGLAGNGNSGDAFAAYANTTDSAIRAVQSNSSGRAGYFRGPVKVVERPGATFVSLQKTLSGGPAQEVATISAMYDLSCTGVCARVGQSCVMALHMVGQAVWNENIVPVITFCANANIVNPRRCICH